MVTGDFAQKLLSGTLACQNAPEGSVVCSIHFLMLARNQSEQKKIYKALVDAEVETRIFSAGNLGRHPFWFEKYGEFHAPVADRIHDTGIFLPNHPSLKSEDIKFITNVVLEAGKEVAK